MLLVRLEYAALMGLGFVLPLVEAPKNLLWFAYVCLWFFNRTRGRDFGGTWDRWDTVIALWILSGFLSIPLGGIHTGDWSANNDVLRYGSLLWLLKRSRYDEAALQPVFFALIAGALAALAWGYYGIATHEHYLLGLTSVGHVNHSAIYVAIVFGATLAAARAWWRSTTTPKRVLGLVVLAILVISLVVMQSRGALAAAAIAALLLLAAYSWRLRHGLRLIAVCAALGVVAMTAVLAVKPEILEKRDAFGKQLTFISYRDVIWRTGVAAWREFPLFGVGTDNYSRIGIGDLERWCAKRGEVFDKTRYEPAPHAHNLYVNTLAERGLVGLVSLLALLFVWLAELTRRIPEANAPPAYWTWWGGAASAWLVTVLVGTVNTTLHHEHALLAMLFLGGWLSLQRADGSPG